MIFTHYVTGAISSILASRLPFYIPLAMLGLGDLQTIWLCQLAPCEALSYGDADGEWKTCSFLFPVGFLFASCSWEHYPSLPSLQNLAVVVGFRSSSWIQLTVFPTLTEPICSYSHLSQLQLLRGLGSQPHRNPCSSELPGPANRTPSQRSEFFSLCNLSALCSWSLRNSSCFL